MQLAVGIISLALAIANSWHVIAAWMRQPPNTVFTGIAHSIADYFLYVSQMAEGTLFTSHWFTNEPMQKTWIYWFNGLVGRLGSIFGASPFATYNIALFLLAFGLCLLWWRIVNKVFSDNFTRLAAFLFVLTASNFPGLGDFWFSPMPALNRLGGVPHQIFQTILILGVMLTISRPLFSLPLSFIAATANPIQMLLLVAATFLTLPRRALLVALPALAGALLVNQEFARQPILLAAKAWEAAQTVSVSPLQFLLAIGPIVLLLPFGMRPFFKSPNPLRQLMIGYGVLSLIAFFSPIPQLLGTSSVRWLSPAAYAVLPLIAAAGLQKLPHRGIVVIGYVLLTLPALFLQIQNRLNAAEPLNYVPATTVSALSELRSLPDGVILTNPALPHSLFVPVFTGHPSFTGHPIHTLYPEVKYRLSEEYFAGTMTPQQAEQFLHDHTIVHVIRSLP